MTLPESSQRLHPRSVLILGSGGLRIGQAGEFDYSGSQAIKALKEEGIRTILINPNIATVQTNADMADRVYFLPVTEEFVEQVIAKERPEGVLLGFGGQTALNVGLALDAAGVFRKYRVRIFGTSAKTIRDTEDRELFVGRLEEIDVDTARSIAVRSVAQGLRAAKKIGFPLMLRAAFALGGKGSAKITNKQQLQEKLEETFHSVPQILVEEYLEGWKEVEYEVVRDSADNCVTVCNMENMDPMGIHTGDSIVVAPSQTLTNEEYHRLRSIAQRVVRHLGIIGECNIQYALHPRTGAYRVIEVNARLSRSSALASKATGYPLAWVAAKLALGYQLFEIQNNVTGVTQACFEPALDYIVVKIPRWDLTKFKAASRCIGSEMKSVGEVMGIGRSFPEALQKAVRMLSIGVEGVMATEDVIIDNVMEEITQPTDRRLFAIAAAFEQGKTVDDIHQQSHIDPWFLYHIEHLVTVSRRVRRAKTLSLRLLREAKEHGFSDEQIARLRATQASRIRSLRKRYRIQPVIKQIDTLGGEFPAQTNYLYMTYHGSENDVIPSKAGAVAVIGSGPYRIGSSVEFDWCGVQAVQTSAQLGHPTIMLNCNPETVSTDYDICDRLYFEELTLERVLDIFEFEKPEGVIVSMGGQIPNNLALPLSEAGVPLLGTTARNIDQAEDRHKFSSLLDRLHVGQPPWVEVTTKKQIRDFARRVQYPVLIRPSYVLSGAAMNIAHSEEALDQYLHEALQVSREHPVVVSKFIEGAREVEIDGVSQGGELVIYAMTEHVENAGVHSGDATVVVPPQKTYFETIRRIKKRTRAICAALQITGPFNIQFLAKGNNLKVIELNLRASRSFPFVSKATKYNFADLATKAMLGQDIRAEYNTLDIDYVVVKSPQFSYARVKGADPVLYVEMGSTGEVACFGDGYGEALLKSLLASELQLPKRNILLSIGRDEHKAKLAKSISQLHRMGFHLYATEHTAEYIEKMNIPVKRVYKVSERRAPNIIDMIQNGTIDFIINIPRSFTQVAVTDGYRIRRTAIDHNVSLMANAELAKAMIQALVELRMKGRKLEVHAWDEYEKHRNGNNI